MFSTNKVGGKSWAIIACPADAIHKIDSTNFYKADGYRIVRVRASSEAEAIVNGLTKIAPRYRMEEDSDVDPF